LRTAIIIGAFGALATGVAIGIQATLTSRVGGIIGNIRTGLLTNFLGGAIAGVVVLVLFILQGSGAWKIPTTAVVMVAVSGTLGILIMDWQRSFLVNSSFPFSLIHVESVALSLFH
jgi:hypothetical protein